MQSSFSPKICENNGECSNSVDGPICTCQPGFYGQYCEFEDRCNSNLGLNNPCQENIDNSICVNINGEATCQCYNGFSGPTCMDKINICGNGNYGTFCDIDKYSWFCEDIFD